MPHITNTWRRRLATLGRAGARIVVVIVVVSACINGIGLVWRWIFPPEPPPIAGTVRSVINQTDLVKAFASDCVTAWLMKASTRVDDVMRCFPHIDTQHLPSTPALTVTNPKAEAHILGQTLPDLTTYGVIVSVTEQPYTAAPPTRAYYQIPVSVYGLSSPRALATPLRVGGPPPGADVPLAYPVTVTANSPLATMITGFITCYLTDAPGLERFVTADSGIAPLRTYTSASVSTIQADSDPPENPSDNTELKVLASVSVRTPQYSAYEMTAPLTLRVTAGTWSVAAIDPVPLIDTTAAPVPVPQQPAR
ncbi:conjugal transfer protein [Mycobacterium kansasii]